MNAVDRFLRAAARLGLEPSVQRFPDGTRTAADAAAAVGCEIGQIVKSLVFDVGGEPILILTSGSNRVDEAQVSAMLGGVLSKAAADQVRAATGFAIGGTPPFGHESPLRTLMDEDLMAHERVWAAAGSPDTCFPIAPGELAAVSGAEVITVRSPASGSLSATTPRED